MGSWDYGSLDNDSALDFLSVLIDDYKIEKKIRKLLKKYDDPNYVRAAGELVVALAHIQMYFEADMVDELISVLKEILHNKEWLAGWREEEPVKKSIKKLIKKLEKVPTY